MRLKMKRRLVVLLPAVVLILLGVTWSIAAPIGSSADDDFHATNIWCAWGQNELCLNNDDGTVQVPQILVKSNCYVGFPSDVGAGCLNQLDNQLVTTARVSKDQNYYSPLFYRTLRVFAGANIDLSIHLMRLFNIILAAGLLFWAMAVASTRIRRALLLSWGLALVPIGIFFIASTNPSAWLIPAIGTYWAFLATWLNSNHVSRERRILTLAGLFTALLLSLGARSDGFIYICVVTVAILIWNFRVVTHPKNWVRVLSLGIAVAIPVAISMYLFFNRYSEIEFTAPAAQTSTDQPNPFAKTVVEFPAFIMGLLGAQGPQSGLSTGGANRFLEGYSTAGFYYGIGWMDFNLPSLVGILSGLATFGVIFVAMKRYGAWQVAGILITTLSVVALVMWMRAAVNYQNVVQIQPRYIFPIFLASIGIALCVPVIRRALLSRLQALLVTIFLITSGSFAWLATATRYAVGPDAAYTNFGQTPVWWWGIGPGRLGWFLIAILITSVWVYVTVWKWGTLSSRLDRKLPEVSQNNDMNVTGAPS